MTISSSSINLGKLTNHKEGSIKEILHVSAPLMLSYLSVYLMLFIHRLILAKSSSEAMNAVATISLTCYIFDYGLSGITTMVEVFVGKLNGAKNFTKMGESVWQAIWLCLASAVFCVILAFFGSGFLVPKMYQAIGTNYYIISMCSCPLFGISAAIAAFFVGQGKGYVVTIAILISHVINLVLSLVLIFGLWIFPKLGVTGAAVAATIAQLTQIVILGSIFFNKKNRAMYGSGTWQFNYKIFKDLLQLGLPNSLSHVLELSAWALVARMLATVSNEQVTLFSIGQSLFLLFIFFAEGLQKGVMAISANFIGAKRYKLIDKNIIAATVVHLGFCVILLLILLITNDFIIQMFSPNEQRMFEMFNKTNTSCLWVLLYFAIEGLVWIRTAVLTSLGDVKFIMLANVFGVVFFAVLPIYWLIVRTNGSLMISSWQLVSISAAINLLIFYYRAKNKLARQINTE